MNKTMKLALCATAISAIAATAHAASTTGTATANIANSLTVTEGTPLTFGTFGSSTTAGTIDTAGNVTGGLTNFGGAAPASFDIVGAPSTNVVTSGSDDTVSLSNGSETMSAALSLPGAVMLSNTGTGTMEVTGMLTVAANQASGQYTGTYNVNVNYQ